MKTRFLSQSEIIERLCDDAKLNTAIVDFIAAGVIYGSPEKRVDTFISMLEMRKSYYEEMEIEIEEGLDEHESLGVGA